LTVPSTGPAPMTLSSAAPAGAGRRRPENQRDGHRDGNSDAAKHGFLPARSSSRIGVIVRQHRKQGKR
jgi:hypothetical protein